MDDTSAWLERWREGRIGFHEGAPNALLSQFIDALAGAQRVLVPLCGKTEDMVLLAAHGMQVVGVELSELAVRAFFEEHSLTPQVERINGALQRFHAANYTLYCGDFFACTGALLGRFDAFYDRAAVIALPAAVRGRYVQHVRSLLTPEARGLVITLAYPQERMEGPPFSVPHSELIALYTWADVATLSTRRVPFSPELEMLEGAYAVTPKK